MRRLIVPLSTAACVLAGLANAADQPSNVTIGPFSTADNLQTYYGEYRSRIVDVNPDIRLAAFSAMASSGNLALFDLAVFGARSGNDDVLQDLSARAAFSQVQLVALVPDSDPSIKADSVESFLSNFGVAGSLVFTVKTYDVQQGIFRLEGDGTGQFSQHQLSFHSQLCSATLGATHSDWHYTGYLSCKRGQSETFSVLKVHFDLR